MSTIGMISTLCRIDEYAVIEPNNGGPKVFAYAEDFGDSWNDLEVGVPVKFSSLPGAQGPRAYNIAALCSKLSEASSERGTGRERRDTIPTEDYANAGELSRALRLDYHSLISSVLISAVPGITSDQIRAVCRLLTDYVASDEG